MFSLKRVTWKPRRDVPASEKGLHFMKHFTRPVITFCLDVEQFVLVCVSVYNNKNRSLNKQAVQRKELSR